MCVRVPSFQRIPAAEEEPLRDPRLHLRRGPRLERLLEAGRVGALGEDVRGDEEPPAVGRPAEGVDLGREGRRLRRDRRPRGPAPRSAIRRRGWRETRAGARRARTADRSPASRPRSSGRASPPPAGTIQIAERDVFASTSGVADGEGHLAAVRRDGEAAEALELHGLLEAQRALRRRPGAPKPPARHRAMQGERVACGSSPAPDSIRPSARPLAKPFGIIDAPRPGPRST